MSTSRMFLARRVMSLIVLVAGALQAEGAVAQQPSGGDTRRSERVLLDRVVVRFSAPEGAGRQRPYFIYERELAFEARLVALTDSAFAHRREPFRRHHLQAALERRIAETLLAALPIEPPLSDTVIDEQIEMAKTMVWEACGGQEQVTAAAKAEGISSLEQRALYRRRALASLYLHQMVAPMLVPSQLELRRAHRAGQGPLSDQTFDVAEPVLRRWYVERSLRAAVTTYYQNARSRLSISYL